MRAVILNLVLLTLALAALTWAAEQTPSPALLAGGGASFEGGSPSPGTRDFVFPGGSITLIGDPAVAATLRLTDGCARTGRTPVFHVFDGAFDFAGRLEGSGAQAVVRGEILSPDDVRLHLELSGGACEQSELDTLARPDAGVTSPSPPGRE